MNTTAIKLKSLRDAPRRVQSMIIGANLRLSAICGLVILKSLRASPSNIIKIPRTLDFSNAGGFAFYQVYDSFTIVL